MFALPGSYRQTYQENKKTKQERVVNNEIVEEKPKYVKMIRIVTEKWTTRNENSEIKRIWNDLLINRMHPKNKEKLRDYDKC